MGITGSRDGRERFERIFAANSKAVLGYAIRRVGPDDAADVLSEVMLIAWRRLGDVPDNGDERFWLLGVARKVVANRDRSEARRSRLGERLRMELRDVTSESAEYVGSTIEVREILAGLPEADREILMLTAWEGLQPSEAATVLGIHPAAARTRLHRARARFRKALSASTAPAEPQHGKGDRR